MRIEDLLECSADQLKAMSDEELKKHFEPMFCVTRPELAAKPMKVGATQEELGTAEQRQEAKLKIAKLRAMGVEVDERTFIRNFLKKK